MNLQQLSPAELNKFPIESKSQLFRLKGMVPFCAESQLFVGDELIALLFCLGAFEASSSMQFYIESCTQFPVRHYRNSDDLKELFKDDIFLNDFYGRDLDGRFILYNSQRDNICIIFSFGSEYFSTLIERWDAVFEDHMKDSGIGFGKAGEIYGQEILGALPSQRFGKMAVRER